MGYEVEAWSDFFVATAGATAALAGLLFVAVSINLDRILSLPGIPDRALGTLILLLGVLVTAVFGLAPGQSDGAAGLEIAFTGALTVGGVGLLTMRISSAANQNLPSLLLAAAGFLGTVPFLVGGLSLAEGTGGGLYWILAGTAAAIVGAVVNAWVLLVEILR